MKFYKTAKGHVRVIMNPPVSGAARYDSSFDLDLATPCTEFNFDGCDCYGW